MFSAGVVPPRHYGGTERVVDWLIKELTSMGHKIYFFGPHGSYVPSAEKIFYLDFPRGNINENPIDFREMIPQDTDIVHIHCATNLDYGYPVLKTVHGYPFHKGVYNFAEREQFDEYYSFLSDSHRKVCGRPENPFVYNGLDLNEYIYSEEKEDYFLFLGKLDWAVKGLPFALKIAMEMKLKLIIAGDFLIPSTYEKILKGFLNKDIRYVGPVGGKEKAELLAKARALLFPVIWPEPFGLVVIEALASGTPVLSSCEGALPEIMVQGVTGFMCKTIGEMKAHIKSLDQIDPKKCREHIEKHFTSRRMALDYLRVYDQMIDKYHNNQ
jgi:glycosyltransferase involved in cell wall biosynthesis